MMRDCPDGELRDMLPLHARDRLPPADGARVDEHVARCADCASELELLRSIARAYDVAPVDVAAIAAGLPKARVRPAKLHVPFHRQPLWRVAASLTLVIASVAMVELVRRGGVDGMVADSIAGVDSAIGQPVESTLAVANTGSTGTPDGPRATFGGTLAELTDAQLEALLASINDLDGNVLADPETMVTPIVPSSPDADSRRN